MPRVYTLQDLEDLQSPGQRLVSERLWSFIDKNGPLPERRPDLGPCWVWTGGTRHGGYGAIVIGSITLGTRKSVAAHRLAFLMEHEHWPTPCGLHHCDNPPCCKVIADEHGGAHVYEGTKKDNAIDCATKGRHANHLQPERVQGERNPRAKLTWDDVNEIRRDLTTPAKVFARRLGVTRESVLNVRRYATWPVKS